MNHEQYTKKPSILARIFAAILSLFLIFVFILFAYFSFDEAPIAGLITLALAGISFFFFYRAAFTASRALTDEEAKRTASAMKWIQKMLGHAD